MLDVILLLSLAISAGLNFYLGSKIISGRKKRTASERVIRELETSLQVANARPQTVISPPAPLPDAAASPIVRWHKKDGTPRDQPPAPASPFDRDEEEEELPTSGPLPVIVIDGGPRDRQYIRVVRGDHDLWTQEAMRAMADENVRTGRMPEAKAVELGYTDSGLIHAVSDWKWNWDEALDPNAPRV